MLIGICILDLQDHCILHFLILQVSHFFEYQTLIIYVLCVIILLNLFPTSFTRNLRDVSSNHLFSLSIVVSSDLVCQ